MTELPRIDQCLQHGALCIFFCSECNGDVACQECVTSLHCGHKLISISDGVVVKKTEIQDTLQKSKNEIVSVIDTIESSSGRKEENSNNIRILIDQIKSQGEKMKEKTDQIVNGLVTVCKEIEKGNSSRLSEYEKDLEKLKFDLSIRVNECQKALHSDNNVLVHKVAKNNETKLKRPKAPLMRSATFTPGPCKLLQENIGSLCRKYESRLNSEFVYTSDITSSEYAGGDLVWIANYKDRYISQVDEQGAVKNIVKVGYDINSMSVSPKTGNLWCCCYFHGIIVDWNEVFEVSDLKATSRFSVESKSSSICVTTSGDILVGSNSLVTAFTPEGKKLRSLEDSCYFPREMSRSSVTGDIAVCDRGKELSGVKPHVLVLDTDLQMKFRYFGLSNSQCSFYFDFYPYDAVYDECNRLLISDSSNKCIQLVSGEGQFLSIIHSDDQQPTCLTLTKNGLLFVAFQNGKVKIMEMDSQTNEDDF